MSVQIESSGSEPRPPELGRVPVSDGHARLVVAGFGMVAHKLVDRLAALGALNRFAVTVVGEEPYPAYDRVRLTEWLDHGDTDRLALVSPAWNQELGMRVITGDPVVCIDRARHAIQTAGGTRLPYDRLVLATGSAPFVPPIEGADHEHVFLYRTVDDLDRIRRRARDVRAAIVIGGGLLGLEAGGALRRLGLRVTVLEAASHLMSRQVDAGGAALLEARLRELGIATAVGVKVRRIEGRGDQVRLSACGLDRPLLAGMVVIAAGIRPRDELARRAGLAVAAGTGGIVVNDELRTSDPAIHAIGECAWHNGTLYGLAAPGFRMAETLAEILAGRLSRFVGYRPAVRLRLMGIDLWSLGDQAERGTHISWSRQDSHRRITLRKGRAVAASSIGPWEELGQVQTLIRQHRRVWPWQRRNFRRTGKLISLSTRYPMDQWPASSVVCNCLEITRGALGIAIDRGCSSAQSLVRATGASTVCGSCRPLLAELTGDLSSAAGPKGRKALLVASAVAMTLIAAILAGPPLPMAASLQESGLWDTLYRDGWWRRATGFATLGCVLLGTALLSLRKRWRRAARGDLGWWRLAHGLIGVLALLILVGHTGLRLGTGFNRVLMLSFLAATVFGGATAAGLGGRYARLTSWCHVLAVWPLPVLLAFHILSSYYY